MLAQLHVALAGVDDPGLAPGRQIGPEEEIREEALPRARVGGDTDVEVPLRIGEHIQTHHLAGPRREQHHGLPHALPVADDGSQVGGDVRVDRLEPAQIITQQWDVRGEPHRQAEQEHPEPDEMVVLQQPVVRAIDRLDGRAVLLQLFGIVCVQRGLDVQPDGLLAFRDERHHAVEVLEFLLEDGNELQHEAHRLVRHHDVLLPERGDRVDLVQLHRIEREEERTGDLVHASQETADQLPVFGSVPLLGKLLHRQALDELPIELEHARVEFRVGIPRHDLVADQLRRVVGGRAFLPGMARAQQRMEQPDELQRRDSDHRQPDVAQRLLHPLELFDNVLELDPVRILLLQRHRDRHIDVEVPGPDARRRDQPCSLRLQEKLSGACRIPEEPGVRIPPIAQSHVRIQIGLDHRRGMDHELVGGAGRRLARFEQVRELLNRVRSHAQQGRAFPDAADPAISQPVHLVVRIIGMVRQPVTDRRPRDHLSRKILKQGRHVDLSPNDKPIVSGNRRSREIRPEAIGIHGRGRRSIHGRWARIARSPWHTVDSRLRHGMTALVLKVEILIGAGTRPCP